MPAPIAAAAACSLIRIKDDLRKSLHCPDIMASLSYSSEEFSRDAFRAVLPDGGAHAAIADRLCALGDHERLDKGVAMACQREHDRLVFLARGAAKLVAQSQSPSDGEGAVHVLAFHFAGDMISVLRQGEGDFRFIALADCDLLVFPTDQFLDIAQSDPVVLRWILTRSLQALHRSRTRMMQLGHKSARQRIADFLVSMAERLSDSTSGACRLILPMSRRDIGDSLGLTIETVSRQFTELREAGLIETKGRSLVQLMDISALAHAAGQSRLSGAGQEI
jgi:CRP/FNR family transcriptional regulator, anaerobic regulatory protein